MNRKTLYALGVLTCAVLILALRLHTAGEALERDIAVHGVIGNEMLHGRSLYSDLWDHKPPLTYLAHAAFIALFGFSQRYVLAMNVAFALLSLLGVCWFARLLAKERWMALAAGLFFSLLSFDMLLQANSEALAAPLLIWGIALWHAAATGKVDGRWSILAGALAFGSTLFKQQYILMPGLAALGSLAEAYFFSKDRLGPRVKMALAAGAVVVAGWALLLAIYWATGSLGDFIRTTFLFNQGYAGDLSLAGFNLLPRSALSLLPYLIATGLYLLATPLSGGGPSLLLTGWLLGAYLAVLLPGQYFAHYYQLLIPVLILGTVLLIHLAFARGRRILAALICAGVLAFSIAQTAEALSHPAREWSEIKYPGASFAESRALGLALRELLPAGEALYYFGASPSLFLYSGARAANSVFYSRMLKEPHILRAELAKREVANFYGKHFDIAIFGSDPVLLQSPGFPSVQASLDQDFEWVPTPCLHNKIYVRKSSPLLARLRKGLPALCQAEMADMGLAAR
jgi:4-amino-4-deoxy-L-arabinose transferase-like glycosyltransferase